MLSALLLRVLWSKCCFGIDEERNEGKVARLPAAVGAAADGERQRGRALSQSPSGARGAASRP